MARCPIHASMSMSIQVRRGLFLLCPPRTCFFDEKPYTVSVSVLCRQRMRRQHELIDEWAGLEQSPIKKRRLCPEAQLWTCSHVDIPYPPPRDISRRNKPTDATSVKQEFYNLYDFGYDKRENGWPPYLRRQSRRLAINSLRSTSCIPL